MSELKETYKGERNMKDWWKPSSRSAPLQKHAYTNNKINNKINK
jgi:hypothetical protein